jgi:hypothetical protein
MCLISILIHTRHWYWYMPDINISTWPTSISICGRYRYLYVVDIYIGTVLTLISICGRYQHRYVTDINTGILSTSISECCQHRYCISIDSIAKALFRSLSIRYWPIIINSKWTSVLSCPHISDIIIRKDSSDMHTFFLFSSSLVTSCEKCLKIIAF